MNTTASGLPLPATNLSIQGLVDRLQYDEFFKLFSPQVRHEIFQTALYKSYKAGDVIYQRGDKEAFMGAVMSGRLRMSVASQDGRSILVGLVECGEVFGETALLDGLPRTMDAEAETETTLMILRREDFIPALRAHPDAMFDIIKMLCHRLRIYINTIDLIGLQNLPRRLARHLLHLAHDYGAEENGQWVIRSGLNQGALGQQLATSRESINKQLKEFTDQGLINIKNNIITLLDLAGLQHVAGQ